MNDSSYTSFEKIALAVLGLAILLVGWHCATEVRSLPGSVAFPMAGCGGDQPVARVDGDTLHLVGSVDNERASRIRQAAHQVWWVSGVKDSLAIGSCSPCSISDAQIREFKVLFETNEIVPKEPNAANTVREFGASLKQCGLSSLEVTGWADVRWDRIAPHNRDLAVKRADALADLLATSMDQVVARFDRELDDPGTTTMFNPKGLPDLNPEALEQNRRAQITKFAEPPKTGEPQMQSLLPPSWAYTLFWGCWVAIGGVSLLTGTIGSVLLLKYLKYLRTEPELMKEIAPSLADREHRLEIIEGIGDYYAREIEKRCDIKTIPELAALTNPAKILLIAALHPPPPEHGGGHLPMVGHKRTLEWIAMAKLIQLPTITKDWAELLVASEIRSVEELANANPHALCKKLVDVNKPEHRHPERHLAEIEPTESEVEYMVALAKDAVNAAKPPNENDVPFLAKLLRLRKCFPTDEAMKALQG